ncbi:MAG: NHL repeat-containing protein [Verrucomicrobiia bacterium]
MRTSPILWAATILTMSLVPASAQIYHFDTIAGLAAHSGGTDGTNSAARFNGPDYLAMDSAGNVYVSDFGNDTIRKIATVGTNWVVSTVAGLTDNPGSADGTNSAARFSYPNGVAVGTNGNVYVADWSNNTIRAIAPIGTNWVVSTIAGQVGVSGHADGTNAASQFSGPSGVAVDTNGNIYVGDFFNSTIRKIAPVGTNWVASTIAGLALNTGSADGTNSVARFNGPNDVAVDTNGNVYVADWANSTIRKIAPVGTNWIVSTIAGLALNTGSADGTNSDARFNGPTGVAVDSSGNVYVADAGNNTIRKITPVDTNWVVSTIGGLAGVGGSTDGIKSNARFYYPRAVAVDTNGNVYVADTGNNTIRQGVLPSNALTITKEMAKLNFAKTNSDSCTLTATLNLDASYDLTNKPVSLDIGGADASFTLDTKGKGHGVGTYGTCKLSYKKKIGPWTFTTALKKGSWASQWETYGLSNATTTVKAGVPVTLPVTLFIGDDGFYGEKALLYKAKAGKSGTAK